MLLALQHEISKYKYWFYFFYMLAHAGALKFIFPINHTFSFISCFPSLKYGKLPVEGCSITGECSICQFWSSKVWEAASVCWRVFHLSILEFQSMGSWKLDRGSPCWRVFHLSISEFWMQFECLFPSTKNQGCMTLCGHILPTE